MKETMTLNPSRRIEAFVATLSASLLLALFASGTAHANTFAASPAPTTMTDCNKLPVSQRGMCKSQVGWSQTLPASAAVDRTASARTQSAMSECKSLPVSDRGICQAQAGYGQKVPQELAPNQRIALEKANARYRTEIAACNRMPVSDHNICVSQAGDDVRLAQTG